MNPIIVGIDPGTTSAFAVLSFDFEVLKINSKKNYSLSKLITDVYKVGIPILVGTDKKHVPKFIKEFSQKTGAKIHRTKYDTKKGEKKTIVKEYKLQGLVKNAHETDALASAIFALNDYKPLINKINKYVSKNNKKDIRDKIIIEVISREKSIKQTVSDIEKKPKKKISKTKPPKVIEKKEISKEQKQIALLTKTVEKLKNEIKKIKQKKPKQIDIDKETRKIISFKEQRALHLEKLNSNLRKELKLNERTTKQLNTFIRKSKKGIIIKKLNTLGHREYKDVKIEKDDILLVKNITVTSREVMNDLLGMVKVIIYEKGTNKSLDQFILVPKKNLISEVEQYALIEQEELNQQITNVINTRKINKNFIQNILEDYKRQRLKDIE